FCVCRYEFALTAILSSRLLVFLGEISYSIYTVHTWTLRIFTRPAVDYSTVLGIEAVFRIVVAIVVTLVFASATYSLIEVPARAAVRRRFSLRRSGTVDDGALAESSGSAPNERV